MGLIFWLTVSYKGKYSFKLIEHLEFLPFTVYEFYLNKEANMGNVYTYYILFELIFIFKRSVREWMVCWQTEKPKKTKQTKPPKPPWVFCEINAKDKKILKW